MKIILIINIFLCFYAFFANGATEVDKAFLKRVKQKNVVFNLYSPHIYNNREILDAQAYNGFECKGNNISPKLIWDGAPKNTKSFAITIYDKDAKTGSGWWNWIVYNIPATATFIDTNASKIKKFMPKNAISGRNDYGKNAYGGMCAEKGKKHRYIITLYALNVEKINLKKDASGAMIGLYLNKYKIASRQINAFYINKNNIKEVNKKTIYKKGKIKYDTSKMQNKSGKNKDSVLNSKNKNKKVIEEKNEKQ